LEEETMLNEPRQQDVQRQQQDPAGGHVQAGAIGRTSAMNMRDPDFQAEMTARNDREIRATALHAALALNGGAPGAASALIDAAGAIEAYLRNGAPSAVVLAKPAA